MLDRNRPHGNKPFSTHVKGYGANCGDVVSVARKRLGHIGVLLIPSLCLAGLALSYIAHQRLAVNNTVRHLQTRTKQQVDKLEQTMLRHKQDLESLARNTSVTSLVLRQEPWSEARTKQLHAVVMDLNETFQFKNVTIATKDQRVLFRLYPGDKKRKLGEQESKVLNAMLRSRQTVLSQLQPYENSEGTRAWLATPLTLSGKTVAAVVATVETGALHNLVARAVDRADPTETVVAFLQDEHIHVISNHPLKLGLLSQSIAFGDPRTQALQQALRGKQGSGEDVDINGVDTLAAWQAVPNIDIAVMTQVTKRRIIWPIGRIYLVAAGAVLLINLLCLLILQVKQQHRQKSLSHLPSAKWAENMFVWQLLLLAVLAATIFSHRYHQVRARLRQGIDSQAQFQLAQAGRHINRRIKNIEAAAVNLAGNLSSRRFTHEQIAEQLRQTVQEQPNILGIGIAYAPYAYQKNLRLYAPYMLRTNKGIRGMWIEDTYDYTLPESPGKPKTNWYHEPLKANRSMWLKPYFGSASRDLLSSYVVPFYNPRDKERKRPIGVVEIMQNLTGIRELASAFSLHGIGYSFIVDENGTYIYHPFEDYVHQQTSIQEVSNREHQAVAKLLTENFLKDKSSKTFSNTQGLSWTYALRVPETDWIFAMTFREAQLENAKQILKPLLAANALSLFTLAILLIGIAVRFTSTIRKKTDFYSLAFSAAAACTLAFLWIHMLAEPPRIHLVGSTPISERAEVDRYITAFAKSNVNHSAIVGIPTGITLESIEFVDFRNARVSGYCWQKYRKDKNLAQGVMFSNATESQFQEVYRENKGDFEVVGWNFTATLIQKNDHWRYPFDDQNVVIFLENSDLNADAILTPDSDSYELLHPESTPGISLAMKDTLPIRKSLFMYTEQRPASTLGLMKTSNLRDVPNLAFAVGIKRSIVNPIVFYFIPLMTILFCMYFVLLMQEKIDRGELIGSYLTLLFTLILLHRGLRSEMQAHEMFYIEHFLMATYAIILFIFSNVFLEAKDPPITRMTRFLRVAFWPLTFISWLFSTIYVFLH